MTYEKTFFVSKSLKRKAKKYLKVLPKDVTCLASSGSSGVAIASAMLVLSKRKLKHWYIRKPKEGSHGGYYAGLHNSKDIFAIVDDFISSGTTVNRIINIIKQNYSIKKIKCVIVTYDNSEGTITKKGIKIIETK